MTFAEALDLVSNDGLALKRVGEGFENNKAIVKAAFFNNPSSFKHASPILQQNRKFILSLLSECEYPVQDEQIKGLLGPTNQLRTDRGFALKAVHICNRVYCFLPPEIRGDKLIAREAIFGLCENLESIIPPIPDFLFGDKEFVLDVIQAFIATDYEIIASRIKFEIDREFALEAVRRNGCSLSFMPEEFKDDEEIALEAIREAPEAYEFVSDRLKESYDFTELALYANPEIFDQVWDNYQIDPWFSALGMSHGHYEILNLLPDFILEYRDFAVQAVHRNAEILNYLPDCHLDDRDLVLTAFTKMYDTADWSEPQSVEEQVFIEEDETHGLGDPYDRSPILGRVSDRLKDDREIALLAVRRCGEDYNNLSERLRRDYKIAIEAISAKYKPLNMSMVHQSLINKRWFVLEAVKARPSSFGELSLDYRNDKELALLGVKSTYPFAQDTRCSLVHVGDRIRFDDDVVKCAVEYDPFNLEFASYAQKNDPEIVMLAVSKKGETIEFAAEDPKNDLNVCLTAVRENPKAILYIDLRSDQIVYEALKADENRLNRLLEERVSEEKLEFFFRSFGVPIVDEVREVIEQGGLEGGSEMVEFVRNSYDRQNCVADLKSLRHLILEAVRRYPSLYRSLPEPFAKDNLIAWESLLSPDNLAYAPLELFGRLLFIQDITRHDPSLIRFADPSILNDIDCAFSFVANSPLVLKYLPEEFKNNKELAFLAIGRDKNAFDFISEDLKKDPDILAFMKGN